MQPTTSATKKPKLADVRIRNARESDKGSILEISRKVWGGSDYVPTVWDQWLAGTNGQLLVATVQGIPVAVAHGYLQTRDVAWLEGVRVHERYRGYGIAGKLNKALVLWAREEGARVARLCTGSSNIASRKHLAKTGFHLSQIFQKLDSTRSLTVRPAGVTRPKGSIRNIWNWVMQRPEFADNRAMYSDGWTWFPLTFAVLRESAQKGRILLTLKDNRPSSVGIFLEDDRKLTLGFAAGDPKGVTTSARTLRFMLSKKIHDKIRALVPVRSPLVRELSHAGFEKTAKILVYEKFLG